MSAQLTADGAGAPERGTGAVALSVVRVTPDQWASHRALRLDMLATDPDAFWSRLADVEDRTEQQWRDEIAGPRIHLQARQGEAVLGGIAVLPQGYTEDHQIRTDQAILVSLWVRPEARGTGVSTALFQAAATVALELGRPELLLEVDGQNAPARRMYERLGFRETGHRPPRVETGGYWVEYSADARSLRLGNRPASMER